MCRRSSVRPRVLCGDAVAPLLKAARMRPAAVLVHSKRTTFKKAADLLRPGILALYLSRAVFMRRWTGEPNICVFEAVCDTVYVLYAV